MCCTPGPVLVEDVTLVEKLGQVGGSAANTVCHTERFVESTQGVHLVWQRVWHTAATTCLVHGYIAPF